VRLLDDQTSEVSDRQLESIAHGVLRLHYSPPDYGRQRHTLRIVKLRGVNFQSGTHDFNIATGGVAVFPRLTLNGKAPAFPNRQLISGIENLEQLLHGLDYGTTTIFTGPAGIGKTTLSAMYAYTAAERGEK